jgi:hypothetical protein
VSVTVTIVARQVAPGRVVEASATNPALSEREPASSVKSSVSGAFPRRLVARRGGEGQHGVARAVDEKVGVAPVGHHSTTFEAGAGPTGLGNIAAHWHGHRVAIPCSLLEQAIDPFVLPLDIALRSCSSFLVVRGIDPFEEELGPARTPFCPNVRRWFQDDDGGFS